MPILSTSSNMKTGLFEPLLDVLDDPAGSAPM